MTTRRALAPVALAVVALAGCGSSTTPTAAVTTATSAAAASTAASPTTAASTTLTAAQQAYAGQITAAGFFPGTPASIIDADGNAVCGSLQSESMSAEIAYEESVDENTTTGMTTNTDIVKYVRYSVQAWCPKYEGQLPGQ